jgi:uncharacterized protein
MRFIFYFLFLFSLCSFRTAIQDEIKIPELSGPVMDEANVLSPQEKNELELLLRSFLPLVQMQIWTIPNLANEPIESLSIRAADKWKLGTEKKDNGLIILIAPTEHRMRIEVGQGLEGDIPDALAGRMMDSIMAPHFRQNDYYGGLKETALTLYQYAKGDRPTLPEEPKRKAQSSDSFVFLFIFLFIAIFLFRIFSRFRGGGGSGFGGGFYSGGWSSGGGGGGSWSGGGGGFSGGGSSGSW